MHVTQLTPADLSAINLAFVEHMGNADKKYKIRAIKLVSISRDFAQAAEHNRSYDELRSVLQVVDDTLRSASKAREGTSNDVDAKFKRAIDALNTYEKKYHSSESVTQTMAEAEAVDKLSSTVMDRRKEKTRLLKKEPTKIVEFLFHRSIPDKNPIIVKLALRESSDIKEILWNLSLFTGERRLTLKDNPHFYENLPTSAEKYDGQFRTDPITTIQQGKKISVLTDNPLLTGRLFLETAKEKRVFGNVWVCKDAIIVKDICGRLEGEDIIGSAIKNTPNLWCFEELEEPSLSNASWPEPPDRSSPSQTTTAIPITSPTGALLEDWREPILRMLRSPGVKINIRISDTLPNSFSSSYSESSLPIPLPPPDSNSIVGNLSPTPPRILSPSDAGAAHGALPSQEVSSEDMNRTATPQITHERNPSPNGLPLQPTSVGDKPRCMPQEDDNSASSMEHHAKLMAPDASSKKEVVWLENERLVELERQLSEMRAVQSERDRRIAQLNDQLVQNCALLEQAEANGAEALKRAGLEKRELQAKLGELLLSRDKALEQVQIALQTTSRTAEANERSQLERELAEMHAKLEARESALVAVRLRLTDAEDGWAKIKAKAGTLQTVTASAASLVDLNEDRALCEDMEDMQVMGDEFTSLQRNEKNDDWSNEG